MIGFEVAPVAPSARFVFTKSGSTESSQSLVPVAISDCRGEVIASSSKRSWFACRLIGIISQAADGQHLLSKAGGYDKTAKTAARLSITATLAIFPILTLIPDLR